MISSTHISSQVIVPPPVQPNSSPIFEWASVAPASDSFCAQRVHFIEDSNLTWDAGNILMISEGRSGSDNVFTLQDGSFCYSCPWKSLAAEPKADSNGNRDSSNGTRKGDL